MPNFALQIAIVIVHMDTFSKQVRSFVLIIILLFNFIYLKSQNNDFYQTVEYQNFVVQNQDSILDANTNLKSAWKQAGRFYFPNRNPYVEMRYSQMILNGKQLYYIDILKNTSLDPDKFPITFQDTTIVDPLFLPLVFDGKLFVGEHLLKLDPIIPSMGKKYPFSSILDNMKNPFEINEYDRYLRRKIYWDAILADPSVVDYNYNTLMEKSNIGTPETLEVNVFSNLFKVENNPDFSNVGTPTRHTAKRKSWTVKGTNQFQISQNYISDNWYKGGVGNLNMISNQSLSFNYSKNKIQNNNLIEWKLSLYSTPKYATSKDTLRRTKIGTDLFRTYSDFGFRAFGDKWSYSTNLEFKTQLFNNYVENSNAKTAAFLSPLFVNMGILGMKYQLNKTYKENKYKTVSFNADISPLSVKYIYVRNPEDVNPTRYGIPNGDNSLLVLGSLINSSLKINFSRGVSLTSRFKCFTDYDKIELESENELNLAINRYFSTRLYLYTRYDDSNGIKKDPGWGYWQVNEVISFGLNYTW